MTGVVGVRFERVLLLGILMVGLAPLFAFAEDNSSGSVSPTPTVNVEARASPSASPSIATGDQENLHAEAMRTMMRKRLETYKDVREELRKDSRFHRCAQFDDADQREACVKTETGIGELARDKIKCDREERNKTPCNEELKEKVKTAWRFRFEVLIEKAEALKEKGVPADLIDNFTSFVKDKMVLFEGTNSTEEKKQIVKDVVAEWKEFRKSVLKLLVEQKIQNATVKLESALEVLKSLRAKMVEKGFETTRIDEAISKLEANIVKLKDPSVSLREKWVIARQSIMRLQHAKLTLVKMANHEKPEDFVENESTEVPAEVAEAEATG